MAKSRLVKQDITTESPVNQEGESSKKPVFVHAFFIHDSAFLEATSLKLLAWSQNFIILPHVGDLELIEYPDPSGEQPAKKLGQFLVDDLGIQLWPIEYKDPQQMMNIFPTAQAILSTCSRGNVFKGERLPFGIQQINKTGNKARFGTTPYFVYKECEVYRLKNGCREILTLNLELLGDSSYKVLLDTSSQSYRDEFSNSENSLELFCRHIIRALHVVLVAETDLYKKADFIHNAVAKRYKHMMKCADISSLGNILPICNDLYHYASSSRSRNRKASIRSLKADFDEFARFHQQCREEERPKEQIVQEAFDHWRDPTSPSTPLSKKVPPSTNTSLSTPLSAGRLNPMATPFIPTPTPMFSPSPAAAVDSAKLAKIARAADIVFEKAVDEASFILLPHAFDAYGRHYCRFPNCDRLTLAIDETSLCCPWCGPFSWVRYCGPQHLIQDIFDHYGECGTLPLLGSVKLESLEKRHLQGLVGKDVGKGEGLIDRLREIVDALRREGWEWEWDRERE